MLMGWITKITSGIKKALGTTRPPVPTIPPILLLCEIAHRPGLSAISLTSNIIARLPEIGFDTGVNEDGSANMVNLFVKILSEEIIKEIQMNGVVNCAIPVGSIQMVDSTGAISTNMLPIGVNGITR